MKHDAESKSEQKHLSDKDLKMSDGSSLPHAAKNHPETYAIVRLAHNEPASHATVNVMARTERPTVSNGAVAEQQPLPSYIRCGRIPTRK